MQQQSIVPGQQTYQRVIALLEQSLIKPTASLEKQLHTYPISIYLQIMLSPTVSQNVGLIAASTVKMILSAIQRNNETIVQIAQIGPQLEQCYGRVYLDKKTKILCILDIVLTYYFEITLGSASRCNKYLQCLNEFEGCQNLRKGILNLRVGKALLNSLTEQHLNNETIIGELINKLKRYWLVNSEFISQDRVEILSLLIEQISVIIEQVERVEEEQNIPEKYVRQCKQLQPILLDLLSIGVLPNSQQIKQQFCISKHQSMILGSLNLPQLLSRSIVQLKYKVLELWNNTWIYHSQQALFLLSLNTFGQIINYSQELFDNSQLIIQQCLKIIQRSVSHQPYALILFNNRQIMIITLFTIISAQNSEIQLMNTNPQYFTQISQDFCMKQDNEMIKTRAGSLLAMLCLSVDGYLTMTFNICLLSLQKQIGSKEQHEILSRLWNSTQNTRIETSLLVLGCISDQVEKRTDLKSIIMNFLKEKQNQLTRQLIEQLPLIIISRYILIYSFYSFPGCLDKFLPLINTHPLLPYQFQSALKIISHYFNKTDPLMQKYTQYLFKIVLLSSETLTPLLQSTILTKYQLIQTIQIQVLEKLINWFMISHQKQSVKKCMKISSLIIILIENYKVVQDSEMVRQLLAQYLFPIYKALIRCPRHPVQQFIIQIACVHGTKIGALNCQERSKGIQKYQPDTIDKSQMLVKSLSRLWKIIEKVVNRNEGILNTSLELLIGILKYQPKLAAQMLPCALRWIELVKHRDCDLWEIAQLIQHLILYNGLSNHQLFNYLINSLILKTTSKPTYRRLIFCVYAAILKEPTYSFVPKIILPLFVSPPEYKIHCIYLVSVLNNIKQVDVYIMVLQQLVKKLSEIQLVNKKNFEDELYQGQFVDEQEIQNYQRLQKLQKMHPLYDFDLFGFFRKFWQKEGQNILHFDGLKETTRILLRKILRNTKVDHSTRQVYKVKLSNKR